MQEIDQHFYGQFMEIVNCHFDLSKRLPSFVFKNRKTHKIVISESRDFHRVEIFERLGAFFNDKELNSLILEPDLSQYYQSPNRYVVRSIPLGQNFRKDWDKGAMPFSVAGLENQIMHPWFIANSLCYFGSSQSWCSYHDNFEFELDIFYVPLNCDVQSIFGETSWSYSEIAEMYAVHKIPIERSDLDELKLNYFAEST